MTLRTRVGRNEVLKIDGRKVTMVNGTQKIGTASVVIRGRMVSITTKPHHVVRQSIETGEVIWETGP